MKFVLASANPSKIAEMRQIMAPMGIEILSKADAGADIEVEETGTSFAENALLKARTICAAAGLPAIADDSGLVVDALDGRPGVYSARYAGAHASDAERIAKLLAEMARVRSENRSARFVSVIACVFPDGGEITAEGVCEGTIALTPQGEGGFGYDPIFAVPDCGGRTFAQISAAEKNKISHRGRALAVFGDKLQVYLKEKQG